MNKIPCHPATPSKKEVCFSTCLINSVGGRDYTQQGALTWIDPILNQAGNYDKVVPSNAFPRNPSNYRSICHGP